MAQGEGLNQPLTCTFSNGSVSLASQAHIHDAGRATCQAPSWPQINSTQVQLAVSWGSCQQNMSYYYYVNPLVASVSPKQGPRYGSFDLTLNLEDNLTLPDPQVAWFQTSIWIYMVSKDQKTMTVNLLLEP